jgi:hypothetical protein
LVEIETSVSKTFLIFFLYQTCHFCLLIEIKTSHFVCIAIIFEISSIELLCSKVTLLVETFYSLDKIISILNQSDISENSGGNFRNIKFIINSIERNKFKNFL